MTDNTYNEWIVTDKEILQNKDNAFIIAVKDCIETQDFPTTGATGALSGYNGGKDATVIKRLRKAGIKIAGKSNLHELCYGITSNNACTGAIKNPHNPAHVPGGSSGGTAVAIATGQVRAGIGTDTGGSTRIPAAFCGVYGFRPTTGRYPSDGLIPLSHRDTAGPMAQNITDIAYLDSIMAGQQNQSPIKKSGSAIRLGVPNTQSLGVMDDAVATLYKTACDKIQSAGATLVSIDLCEILKCVEQAGFVMAGYETLQLLPKWLSDNTTGVSLDTLKSGIKSPDVAGVFGAISGDGAVPKSVYDSVISDVLPALKQDLQSIYQDNNIDAIIWPTVPVLPPKIGEDENITVAGKTVPTFPTVIRNTDMAAVAGCPSLSIPMGVSKTGLPSGLMIDSLPNQDNKVFAISAWIDDVIK